jgi:hypothetical protein
MFTQLLTLIVCALGYKLMDYGIGPIPPKPEIISGGGADDE